MESGVMPVFGGAMLLDQEADFFIHSYYEFTMFGQKLSINTTMVCTVIVCLALFALILFARHHVLKSAANGGEPDVVANATEMIVETLDNVVISNMGAHAKKYMNYVEILMAFILLSNISGLFGLRPPTADYGTTFGLALITFVLIEYAWIRYNGFGVIKQLMDPIPLFLPINLISELATPVSMSLRLFGNVMAGTIMMALWYGLLPWFAKLGVPAFLHVYFDLFSGAIQAYVFGLLTMVFISDKYPN